MQITFDTPEEKTLAIQVALSQGWTQESGTSLEEFYVATMKRQLSYVAYRAELKNKARNALNIVQEEVNCKPEYADVPKTSLNQLIQ